MFLCRVQREFENKCHYKDAEGGTAYIEPIFDVVYELLRNERDDLDFVFACLRPDGVSVKDYLIWKLSYLLMETGRTSSDLFKGSEFRICEDI